MTVRVAVIGAGWVTLNRHLPALQGDPDVEIVGLVAPTDVLARVRSDGTAQKWGLTHLDSHLETAWMADDVDAVMIGTPPWSHTDLVTASLEQGKHVLVEKPFALTTSDADKMIATADRTDRVLALVHNLRFARATHQARGHLAAGRIGSLTAVFGVQSSNHRRRLPTWYKDLPLGLFTDEAPHLVYLLQSFLHDAELESITVGRPIADDDNTPDLVSAVLRSGDGVVGSLQMAFPGAVSEWLLVLMGDEATVVVDFFRDTCVLIPNDHAHGPLDVVRSQFAAVYGHLRGTAASAYHRYTHGLDYGNSEVVSRFVRAVHTGQEPEGMTAADGRAVVSVLEAAHVAAPSSR